jgi:HTH-type transcriptional regulator / antitoxin HipB
MKRRSNSGAADTNGLFVDLTRIGAVSFRKAIRRELASLGYQPKLFARFWASLASGDAGAIPANLVVMADLSRLAEAFAAAGRNVWRTCIRQSHVLLVAFLRGRSDTRCADAVDEILRASEGRLRVCTARKPLSSHLRQHLADALELPDPERLVDVRFSEADRTVWLEFADGLRRALSWGALSSAMNLDRERPALRPETIRIGDHPETLEMLDARGREFQIDSAAIRALLDSKLARNVYAASEAATTSLGERLRLGRESAKLTQSQVADRSGLTQEMISNLERGKHQPRFETLERYAKGLGLSVAALLAG